MVGRPKAFALIIVLFVLSLSKSFRSEAVGDQLLVKTNKPTLGIGESAQLTVTLRRANGKELDVTDNNSGSAYVTTDESMLIPESDGRVTCVGTQGRPEEIMNVTAVYGNLRASVGIHLLAEGPGATLQLLPEKKTLHEGESTKYRVLRNDGTDVTSDSLGTHYLVFRGYGVPDSNTIYIDQRNGTFTALTSLEDDYQQLHPIIFVRYGDLVGWIELRIIKRNRRGF